MSDDSQSILIVDDEFSVRDSLFHWFKKEGFRAGAAEDGKAALKELSAQPWDVVLLDIKMPGMDGIELLKRAKKVAPDTVYLMLTAHGTIETAVEALKTGAFDYLTKPVDPDELSRAVNKALQTRRLATENTKLRAQVAALSDQGEIVAQSPQMARVMSLVESLTDTDVTVLIRGESGTGKELVARAIHSRGIRRYFPLVPVNCGALPETLLETELFGHERGAFTGAQYRRKGKFEQADGGTLFLDEIGSISPRTQVELLRVLDSKEFTRIGGSRPISVDFRVVCATNQDLEELVAEKTFREDLYFRINVFRIDLPPLRERDGDIPLLARHFVKAFATKVDKDIQDIDPEALAVLEKHDWPGNIRELKNAIERAMVMAEPPVLRAQDLAALRLGHRAEPSAAQGETLADVERAHVLRMLDKSDWNISQAARLLEVDRVTLYNKIKKYGLRR
ncbi:MAG: sigma-54-dependent Fis family transcriptional regulator [Myxococcales bacterium]|nr:sigma-54-dependent Fis family transcriptional regulator [Myxococcales bacterium]MCB9581658.1 sigma-54-dependent Fis family transcriptional regulator [Polyangiaceae bacterium]